MTKVVLIIVQNITDSKIAADSIFVKSVNKATMMGVLYNGDPFIIRDRRFLELVRGLELITYLVSPNVQLTRKEIIRLRMMIRR